MDVCQSCNNSYDYCDCDNSGTWSTAESYSRSGRRSKSCSGGVKSNTFPVVITPITNLVSMEQGTIQIWMSKKGSLVSLSFEGFSAQIAGNGVSKIVVEQALPCLPQLSKDYLIRVQLRGVWQTGYIHIDADNSPNMSFYLDISGQGVANNLDTVSIPSTTIVWDFNA